MATRGIEYLNSSTKRKLDVVGSVAVGFALSPLVVPASTLATVDNYPTSPIFRHQRVGRNNETFGMLKLRTLGPRMPEEGKNHGVCQPDASAIGTLLRRSGLDEMPQLLNILKGEMSLVGIRAAYEASIKFFEECAPELFEEWREAYSAAKPGLVGPGQLFRRRFRQHSPEIIAKSMQLDIDYVKFASLAEDLRILGSTPVKLLVANLHLQDIPATSPAE